jgi:hypothetical protein
MIDPLDTIQFENEILALVDEQDQYTRSDLQGRVVVLVHQIMETGYKVLSEKNE